MHHCLYDGFPFVGTLYQCPTNIDHIGHYQLGGCFCSLACVVKYMITQNGISHTYLSRFHEFCKDVYRTSDMVVPASDRELIDVYGGDMDIVSWRELPQHHTVKKIIWGIIYPFSPKYLGMDPRYHCLTTLTFTKSQYCMYDGFPLEEDQSGFSCPIKKHDNVWFIYGCFCSLQCVKRYMSEEKRFTQRDHTLLTVFLMEVYQYTEPIRFMVGNKQQIDVYGGSMSIQEWRDSFVTVLPTTSLSVQHLQSVEVAQQITSQHDQYLRMKESMNVECVSNRFV